MRVSKQTWHFQVVEAWVPDAKRRSWTLCEYFWVVLGGTLVVTILLLCCGIGVLLAAEYSERARRSPRLAFQVFILPGAALAAVAVFLAGLPASSWTAFWSAVSTVLGIQSVCVILLGLGSWHRALVRWLRGTSSRKPVQPGSDGLLRSWLKAKKARVCPIIDFTDD